MHNTYWNAYVSAQVRTQVHKTRTDVQRNLGLKLESVIPVQILSPGVDDVELTGVDVENVDVENIGADQEDAAPQIVEVIDDLDTPTTDPAPETLEWTENAQAQPPAQARQAARQWNGVGSSHP